MKETWPQVRPKFESEMAFLLLFLNETQNQGPLICSLRKRKGHANLFLGFKVFVRDNKTYLSQGIYLMYFFNLIDRILCMYWPFCASIGHYSVAQHFTQGVSLHRGTATKQT